MYTFVIRSQDRLAGGSTNDFSIKLPYLAELARHDYWKVSVQRVLFPKHANYPYEAFLINGTANFQAANTQRLGINSLWVEIHLDFGTACHGHDTAIGGGRVVHFVRGAEIEPVSTTISPGITPHESKPTDAIPYEIARPNLTELRVRVYNQFMQPAGMVYPGNIPEPLENTAGALASVETPLPDWWMVIQIEPSHEKKYVE